MKKSQTLTLEPNKSRAPGWLAHMFSLLSLSPLPAPRLPPFPRLPCSLPLSFPYSIPPSLLPSLHPSLPLPETQLCALWHTLYAPGIVSNKLFFLQSFLMVTADGFCNYRGRSTGNIGLEKGDACGKLAQTQVSALRYFQQVALLWID